VPGGVVVENEYELNARVTAIDAEKRTVTVVAANGNPTTFICGPAVRNFDQIHVGDQLKARLTEAGLPFPRTHELTVLLQLCIPVEPLWTVFDRAMAAMSQFGVLVRYPGVWATLSEAQLDGSEWRKLLDSIPTETVRDLRDRALIATLTYSFARIGAALKMKVEDLRPRGSAWTIRRPIRAISPIRSRSSASSRLSPSPSRA
jgi:integrase